jgi:hypothetical protein
MSWKLQTGLGIICFGLGIAGLLQHAGVVSLDTPLFWVLMVPAFVELLPAMLFRCSGNCVDGFFVDSAHGPPFLTVAGVFLVYFLPGGLLAWKVARKLLVRKPICRKDVKVGNNKRAVHSDVLD